ncbi:MAG: phospholipid-binding lipoprotein MlaA [Reinekea sp.]|jgi:phospholipid-binding lipoprotein MlaA
MDKRTQNRLVLTVALCLALTGVGSPAYAAEQDPFEPVNRVVFKFNDFLDTWLLRPTAVIYHALLPSFAENGVRNFAGNLGEIRNAVHNGLQGKAGGTIQSAERFLINSTVGLGGLFDVASKLGIPVQREDLGQTLGVWGLSSGAYLVLPLVGPSSVRDGLGVLVDPWLDPLRQLSISNGPRIGVAVLAGVQTRADLLAAESLLMGDAYSQYRQVYLSKRAYDVQDGILDGDAFLDQGDDFSSDDGNFVDEGF